GGERGSEKLREGVVAAMPDDRVADNLAQETTVGLGFEITDGGDRFRKNRAQHRLVVVGSRREVRTYRRCGRRARPRRELTAPAVERGRLSGRVPALYAMPVSARPAGISSSIASRRLISSRSRAASSNSRSAAAARMRLARSSITLRRLWPTA